MWSSLSTPHFWLFATVAILVARVLARSPYRVWGFALLNVAFAGLALEAPEQRALLVFTGLSWLLLQFAGRLGGERRRRPVVRLVLILPAVIAFVLHKKPTMWLTFQVMAPTVPFARLAAMFSFLGAAYVVVRYVHLAMDAAEDDFRPPSAVEYVAYLCPWFMTVAGPIQRLAEFRSAMAQAPDPSPLTVARALERIGRGLFKALVLAEAVATLLAGVSGRGPGSTLLTADLLLLFLYLDFSGAADVAVGIGTLSGWRTPENFDRPWLARNMMVFWQRWHITLSFWARDYVFNPVSKAILQRFRPSPLLLAALAYGSTMAVIGLWHGVNGRFLAYGLLQGFGIWVCKAWETGLRRWLGRDGFQRYLHSRTIRVLATLTTLQFVALTLLVIRDTVVP